MQQRIYTDVDQRILDTNAYKKVYERFVSSIKILESNIGKEPEPLSRSGDEQMAEFIYRAIESGLGQDNPVLVSIGKDFVLKIIILSIQAWRQNRERGYFEDLLENEEFVGNIRMMVLGLLGNIVPSSSLPLVQMYLMSLQKSSHQESTSVPVPKEDSRSSVDEELEKMINLYKKNGKDVPEYLTNASTIREKRGAIKRAERDFFKR